MKKLFILAAAIVAFASCSKEEPQATLVPTREITFVAGQQATRAAVTDTVGISELTATGFAVYGNMGTTQIFNGVTVSHSTNGNAVQAVGQNKGAYWAPANAADVKYWTPSQTYAFSGVYPISGTGYSMDANGVQKIEGFKSNAETDLVVSNKFEVTLAASEQTKTPVLLTFNHMLSRVQFTFENNFEGSEVVTVSNVVVNGANTVGSADIANGVPTWKDQTTVAPIAFGDMNQDFAKGTIDTTSYKYFIPQTATYADQKTSITVSFSVVVEDNGVVIAQNDYENITLSNAELTFAPGQSYNFTAHIRPTTVGDIYPIEFNVTVTPWGEDNVITLPDLQ